MFVMLITEVLLRKKVYIMQL